jgi:long-chain acyl-CoA synthetase
LVSRAESIRRFRIVATDFTEAAGQLTPTDKIRRNTVIRDYRADIDALYSQAS